MLAIMVMLPLKISASLTGLVVFNNVLSKGCYLNGSAVCRRASVGWSRTAILWVASGLIAPPLKKGF